MKAEKIEKLKGKIKYPLIKEKKNSDLKSHKWDFFLHMLQISAEDRMFRFDTLEYFESLVANVKTSNY